MSGYKDPPKEHQFTSTNQPPNDNKKVPHYKRRVKKAFNDIGVDKLIDLMKDGNLRAIEDAKEWSYGKEPDIIQGGLDINNKTELTIIGVNVNSTDSIKDINSDKTD